MMRTLLLLSSLLALAACEAETPAPTDDDDAATGGVTVVATNPSPGQGDFFFQADLSVEFAIAPDSASLLLKDAAGTELPGETSWNDAGTKLNFDPAVDLLPSSDYIATITWTPTDFEPLEIGFGTARYGEPIEDVPALVDEVYSLDLAGATFIEPPGLGGVLGGLIDGVGVLFTLLPESDFAVDAQPGLQMMGALGVGEGQGMTQDQCTETLAWTAGEDGQIGTPDDTRATFEDPFLRLGPADLNLTIGGVSARLKDVRLVGVWHPDRSDFVGGEFEALIDTRGLDGLFEEGAEEGTICELASEALSVDCQECGAPNPGPFCLFGRAVDVSAERIDGLELEALYCPDILDRFDAGLCPIEEISSLDPDGDGLPSCPQ